MKRLILVVAGSMLFLGIGLAHADPPTTCLGSAVNDNQATDADDFLVGSNEQDVIALGLGNDQYGALDAPDLVCGSEGDDTLFGEDGPDRLNGGPGSDVVAGLVGADTLNGNIGEDTVTGGLGDDVIRGGDDTDVDQLYDGQGSDVVVGTDEDTWFRCDDGENDDHDSFTGKILPDPDC